MTVTVYLRLPQMKSLEPLILMVHSVLQTCTAGGLRPLWNVSTVSIQSVRVAIALHGAHSFVLAQAWHLHAYPPCLLWVICCAVGMCETAGLDGTGKLSACAGNDPHLASWFANAFFFFLYQAIYLIRSINMISSNRSYAVEYSSETSLMTSSISVGENTY